MTASSSHDEPGGPTSRGVMSALSRPITLFPPGLSRAPDELLRAASLPAPIAGLIGRVARRTGLWASERLDVTRELIAHFRDGLEAGRSPDELVRGFGEPAKAAKLIRRAKKRGRPVAWRAAVRTLQAAVALLALVAAVYGFAATRAFMSSPTIARNYVEELNAPIAGVPDSDRAWPLYRDAYLALPRIPKELEADFPNIEATDGRWPLAQEYLAASARSLELIRRAAGRPALGRPLTTVTDVEVEVHSQILAGVNSDEARKSAEQAARAASSNPNPPMINVLLPHLGKGRHFARMLALDVRAAAHADDAARVVDDIGAMFRVSAHMGDDSFLIGGLVELAIHAQACQTLARVLAETPSLLSDEQLAALAHLTASGPTAISLESEKLGFDDMLQRVYSDDGEGDGYMTAEGARMIRSFIQTNASGESVDPRHDVPDKIRDALEVPFESLAGASRKETRDLFVRLIDRATAYAELRPWDRPEASPDAEFEQFVSREGRASYPLVWLLMPALSRAVWAHDEAMQSRDALLVAIACELSKRKFGEYPPSLDALPTSLLARVPLDMFDGEPLRYALRDGRPVIYSIGVDRDDDGGRPLASSSGAAPRWMSAQQARAELKGPRADAIDGDWVLWPPEPRKPKTTEPQ